jgi:hypothetical protein
MGSSVVSSAGNGATILREPDAPLSLINISWISGATSIGFTWTDGAESGGTPIIDYRVWYDQGTGVMIVLEFGILTTSYETEVPLTAGVVYSFKVQARNEINYSEFSSTVAILAAQVPETP